LPTLGLSYRLAASALGTAPKLSGSTEPWVSVDDVAAHLGVAKDSVYRWIERRNLPAHRIGRLWKFKLSDVDEWVRAGGVRTNGGEET